MKKYKLVGITEYAEKHLTVSDLENLKQMIGSEIEESDNVAEIDEGKLFIMPDGVETHIDFLKITTI